MGTGRTRQRHDFPNTISIYLTIGGAGQAWFLLMRAHNGVMYFRLKTCLPYVSLQKHCTAWHWAGHDAWCAEPWGVCSVLVTAIMCPRATPMASGRGGIFPLQHRNTTFKEERSLGKLLFQVSLNIRDTGKPSM